MDLYAMETPEGLRLVCAWFATCDNPAEWVTRGPLGDGVIGEVPICQRCADRVGMPAERLHEYAVTGEV